MDVDQMVEVCPSCCTTLRYDKADYRIEELRDEDTS